MGRSILDIAKEAAERDATAPAPTTLFSTNDRIAKILRGAAKDTMREYLRSARYSGLSDLHSTWIFSLLPGRFAYPMPPDFKKIIQNTEQRNGWPLGLLGPASPETWARWMSGAMAVPTQMGWRIRNNTFFIDPTPQSAELVSIEYVSRFPVVSDIRAGDYDMTLNPPQTIAPVVPRDGWLSLPDASLLQDTKDTTIRYEAEPGFDDAVWSLEPHEMLKRISPNSAGPVLPQVRREEFTEDADRVAFADDYFLSLGMTFRLRRALGMPYAEHAAEYEHELNDALVEDGGGARDFQLGGGGHGYDATPLGGGKWMVS